MTEEEVGRLPKVIIERFPEHLPESVASLGTGEMRVSEQYTLTWRHVDFERLEFIFDGTKNGSPRKIEMHSAVMEAFEEPQEICANPARVDAFSISSPHKWFQATLKKAKIETYRWQNNRHTFLFTARDARSKLESDLAASQPQSDADEC